MKIYETQRWRKKRERILRRDGYICRESKRYGKTVEATTVHHIYPVEDYPELAFEDWNLISLSASKHNKMHDRDTRKITVLGRWWQERVEDKFVKWYRDRGLAPPCIK